MAGKEHCGCIYPSANFLMLQVAAYDRGNLNANKKASLKKKVPVAITKEQLHILVIWNNNVFWCVSSSIYDIRVILLSFYINIITLTQPKYYIDLCHIEASISFLHIIILNGNAQININQRVSKFKVRYKPIHFLLRHRNLFR